jgi:hypothetical protein
MPSACSSDRKANQVLQAAAQPIDRPRHYHVELALGSVSAQRIEAEALVLALGAADAVILVDLDDIAAHPAGNLAQLTFLVGRGLIDGGDAEIENSALYQKAAV